MFCQTSTLYIFALCVFLCGAQFQTLSSSTGRYTSIFFPASQAFWIQGKIFHVNVLHAPKTYIASPKNSIDLCQDVKKVLQVQQPELWNNSQVVNPCKRYFCSESPPTYYGLNGTYVPLLDITMMLNNSDVLHTQVQQYCTKCLDTYSERFDQTLLDPDVNSTCKWYRQGLCDGYCPSSATCFLFNSRTSMCFNADNTYMSGSDFFHFYCVRLRLFGLPIMYFIGNLILLVLNFLLVLLPEMKYISKLLKEPMSTWAKFKTIFALRNQSIFIEIVSNFLYVVAGSLDIINVTTQVFTSYVLFIHFAGLIYSWSLLIILWAHMYNHAQELKAEEKLDPKLVVAWVFVTGVGAVYAIAGITIYIAYVIFPTFLSTQILLLILVFVFGAGLFTVSIFLIVSSARLLCIMDVPKDAAQLGFYFFKLKLTRCIIAFIVILYPCILIIMINGVALLWNDFLSVYFSVGITSPSTCIMAISFSFLTFFTLIHNEKMKSLYCYKPYKV